MHGHWRALPVDEQNRLAFLESPFRPVVVTDRGAVMTTLLEPTLEAARSRQEEGDPSDHRWAVVLAGGEGKRLLSLTKKIAGDNRPKQFCALVDGETLLDQTRRRVWRVARPEQTLVVVTKTHERFYVGQSVGAHSSSLLIQPYNRGAGNRVQSHAPA